MKGWCALTWFAACSSGVIVFLKLVANAVAFAEENLSRLENYERKALRRRREMTALAQIAEEDAIADSAAGEKAAK